jgi:hypothetical protein
MNWHFQRRKEGGARLTKDALCGKEHTVAAVLAMKVCCNNNNKKTWQNTRCHPWEGSKTTTSNSKQ